MSIELLDKSKIQNHRLFIRKLDFNSGLWYSEKSREQPRVPRTAPAPLVQPLIVQPHARPASPYTWRRRAWQSTASTTAVETESPRRASTQRFLDEWTATVRTA